MNVDKPILSIERARHWASVRTLVRRVGDGLAELVESEAEDGCGLVCDDELFHAVRSLSSSLVALFQSEESGECRDQILSDRPELTERVDAMQREHDGLAGAIAVIEEMCTDDVPAANWSDVERRFREFVKALGEHELREASFIQNAYSADIGVGD